MIRKVEMEALEQCQCFQSQFCSKTTCVDNAAGMALYEPELQAHWKAQFNLLSILSQQKDLL